MINIGVTGHRKIAASDELRQGIVSVLTRIRKLYPQEKINLISALAEGADCLVAEVVLQASDSQLIVPLPFPVEKYLHEFSSEKSRALFLNLFSRASQIIEFPAAASKEDAYMAVGAYVVDYCDFLIALWDGKKARGVGGTGMVVELARQKKRPLAWIYLPNLHDHPIQPSYGIEIKPFQVNYERFP